MTDVASRERSGASRVNVLGSLNVDLVTRMAVFPAVGETRHASGFAVHPGGKGANQAVAAAKLDANVAMFGALGDDPLASVLHASLASAGVDAGAVAVRAGTPTGTASIWVDGSGDNAIAIAAGANGTVDAAYVDAHLGTLASGDILLLQGEIPVHAMARLLRTLPVGGCRVILDPAPAFDLDGFPCDVLWLLTPNEHELRMLSGHDTSTADGVRAACREVRERQGVARVLCKAGSRGAYLSTPEGFVHVPGYRVDVVDTTAAGDAFNGALATALAEGAELERAVPFAHAAAALSVGRAGAQPAMPSRAEVDAFRAARGDSGDAPG